MNRSTPVRLGLPVTVVVALAALAPLGRAQSPIPVTGFVAAQSIVPNVDTFAVSIYGSESGVVDSTVPMGGEQRRRDIERQRLVAVDVRTTQWMPTASGHMALEQVDDVRDTAGRLSHYAVWLDSSSLQPLGERYQMPDGAIRVLNYRPGQVTEVDSIGGIESRRSTEAVPAGGYIRGQLDLVVRALPLAKDYHGRIAVYSPVLHRDVTAEVGIEDLVWLRTHGDSQVQCWMVDLKFQDGGIFTYYVAKDTHALISAQRTLGHGKLIVYDRYGR